MEPGIKVIAGGVVAFVLGGLSVYLMSNSPGAKLPVTTAVHADHAPVPATSAPDIPTPDTSAPVTSASIENAESFYQAAEARREQQMADKAEADRLAKLKATKERSVECKFWRQQQKTSSAAAKIEEKIDAHCNLPKSSVASESSAASESAAASESSIASKSSVASEVSSN